MTDTSVPDKDGLYLHVPDESYHGDRGSLSVSGAKLLLPPSCPAKFRYARDHERKPKKEWDFGHVAHRIVLGKGADFTVLDPAVHGLKADGTPSDKPTATAAWKAAAAAARERGRVPIHIDDYAKAEAMAQRVLLDPVAGPLFAEGIAEASLYHTDPETGVRLRGRCDWITHIITHIGVRMTIVDLKTTVTANPDELVRKWWALGYHLQAQWYRDLAISIGLSDGPDFAFVAVEKEPPHVVTVVRYDDDALTEAARLNREAIRLYADCMARGVWPDYADAPVTISIPGWAFPRPQTLGEYVTDSYIYDTDPLEEGEFQL